MTGREKREKTKIEKFEYLENEKRFLDEIKTIFHNYLRAIIGEKMKNSRRKLQDAF